MCTNFLPAPPRRMVALGLGDLLLPAQPWPDEVFPGQMAPIITRAAGGEGLECRVARFGLVPHWCPDAQQAQRIVKGTNNARSETAAVKPSYRGAWARRQWAVVPMLAFFEPCWEDAEGGVTARSVRWRIQLREHEVFGLAALWDRWVDPLSGEIHEGFSLLTVNADGHAVMGRMHRPGEEKRMPVLLPPTQLRPWLQASPAQAPQWMLRMDAEALQASPDPLPQRGARAPKPPKPTPPPGDTLSLF